MRSFLITIDTEGDNIWAAPREITTQNAAWLPKFQELCEKYHLKPTYLVNYEMVVSDEFKEFGRDVLSRDRAEIGMHLHAWNTPPVQPLTADDYRYKPYLIEFPEQLLRAKVLYMTEALEQTFGMKPKSHRAGRWAFNSIYAKALLDFGYVVDSSVTPHVDWRQNKGSPTGEGGTDYRRFPEQPYYLDTEHISRPGNSTLLEVPVTIRNSSPKLVRQSLFCCPHSSIISRTAKRVWPIRWLRPNGRNLENMLEVVKNAVESGDQQIVFMLHSSELMPGGSPVFPDAESICRLYDHLDVLFSCSSGTFFGKTLCEFRELLNRKRELEVPILK